MSRFLDIRRVLCLTQSEMAEVLGCAQSNVSFLDRGQTIRPGVARKLVDTATTLGVKLTFEHVYGSAVLPPPRIPSRSPVISPEDWPRLTEQLRNRGWTPMLLAARFEVKLAVVSGLFHGELKDPPHALGKALLLLIQTGATPVSSTFAAERRAVETAKAA